MISLPNVDDLAVVIRCCGCPESRTGQVFKVDIIIPARRVVCASCQRLLAERVDVVINLEESMGCIRSWTRRLAPPSELGLVEELEEVAA